MASLTMKHLRKIYPYTRPKAKKIRLFGSGEPDRVNPNLEVTEDGLVAVQDFSLEVAHGEFIVLVGPSGCGKSTTLRMIAGLEDITGGELYIGDRFVNDVVPSARDIAMVFQDYALYPYLTVYENMAFALKLAKTPRDEMDRRVREAAEILGITDLLRRKPKALSGGQRQRVAIGRAIVREPKVFLLDEPLSNLDVELRAQMRAELAKLRKKVDTTFIYVTHDQTEAMTLGDRLVVMKDGFIQQVGTPQEVFNHPANLFVATFIGLPKMNVFRGGRLLLEDGRYAVELLGKKIPLSEERQAALRAGAQQPREITVGVRPAQMRLDENGFPCTVRVSEMMGSELHLHMDIQDISLMAVIPTRDIDVGTLSPGRTARFSFDPELMHLFDAETANNLL